MGPEAEMLFRVGPTLQNIRLCCGFHVASIMMNIEASWWYDSTDVTSSCLNRFFSWPHFDVTWQGAANVLQGQLVYTRTSLFRRGTVRLNTSVHWFP
jgi:hypothetical protein